MLRTFVLLIIAVTASHAEDTWAKVRDLKTGVELRIFKKGSTQPVLAKMDEANDERLVIILKDEQKAIPKEEIDRIDYRPTRSGSRAVKEMREETRDSSSDRAKAGPEGSTGPTISSSTNYTFQGKPEFETVYRRALAPPKK